MIELKFLKELPIKSLNKNSTITISGADIYVDKDNNRFAYIEFVNNTRQLMYSLYFVVKQYDSMGTFIKEVNFSLPTIFAKRGSYIIEKPIKLDEECGGIEVFITYAEFANGIYYQDKFGKAPHLDSIIPNIYEGAPKEVSKSFFTSGDVKAETVEQENAPAQETSVVEEKENIKDKKIEVKEEPKVNEKESNTNQTNRVRRVGLPINLVNILLAALGLLVVLAAIYFSSKFIAGTY